jgi:hypothetical protein
MTLGRRAVWTFRILTIRAGLVRQSFMFKGPLVSTDRTVIHRPTTINQSVPRRPDESLQSFGNWVSHPVTCAVQWSKNVRKLSKKSLVPEGDYNVVIEFATMSIYFT